MGDLREMQTATDREPSENGTGFADQPRTTGSANLYEQHDRGLGFRSAAVDMTRCRVETYERISRNFHQCSRKATIFHDGIGYCTQHSPEAEARREQERRSRDELARKQSEYRHRRPGDYKRVLREIAAGHNDPRALATEALKRWGDFSETDK